MKNKLIPLTQFVNNIDELVTIESYEMGYDHEQRQLQVIKNYSAFLSKPLKLEYFAPCDDEDNVLEEPKDFKDILSQGSRVYHYDDIKIANIYQEAVSKVLFEGFEAVIESCGELCLESDSIDLYPKFWDKETIEITMELAVLNERHIILTETALKQIYG